MNEITHKIKYCSNIMDEITEQEKLFCSFILKGMNQRDAVFKAGYYKNEDRSSEVVRRRASVKAAALLKKKCIRVFLNKNAKTVVMHDDYCDRRALKMRIYDIAMGNICSKVFVDGEAIDCPPTFKDQITAAALFYKIDNEDRQEKIASIEIEGTEVATEINDKVDRFLSKFGKKEKLDNSSPFLLAKKGIIDSEYRDVTVERALDDYVDKETSV